MKKKLLCFSIVSMFMITGIAGFSTVGMKTNKSYRSSLCTTQDDVTEVTIEGYVTDLSGEPLNNSEVTIEEERYGPYTSVKTNTDSNGYYNVVIEVDNEALEESFFQYAVRVIVEKEDFDRKYSRVVIKDIGSQEIYTDRWCNLSLNHPPIAGDILGPTRISWSPENCTNVEYKLSATDADGDLDELYYKFFWYERNRTETREFESDLLGPYESGQEVSININWTLEPTYNGSTNHNVLSVRIYDDNEGKRYSDLDVEVYKPKDNAKTKSFYKLESIIQCFPMFERIQNFLQGLID